VSGELAELLLAAALVLLPAELELAALELVVLELAVLEKALELSAIQSPRQIIQRRSTFVAAVGK
jgi:hypothetical protein